MKKTAKNKQISRRTFLATAGGLSIGITAYALMPGTNWENGETESQKTQINAWVHLAPDGKMLIMSPAAEMGQGSLTALPLIFAEEMDADWSKVSIEQSPSDPDIFGMPGFRGGKMMLTVGSFTVKRYFDVIRQAGAKARYVLLHSVAKKWQVAMDELSTDNGKVVHTSSNKSIAYGKVLSFLNIPDSIPEIPKEKLKNPADFRLIGKVSTRYEVPDKVNGSAKFSIDLQVPGMLYASIERGKVHGAKPQLKNEPSIRSMPGLVEILSLDHGIGIIAESYEQAYAIRKSLDINWNREVQAKNHTSETAFSQYKNIADQAQEGEVVFDLGDTKSAKNKAKKAYAFDYTNEYVVHAQMEPLNAIASVTPQGAEIWAGSQAPGNVVGAVSQALGIDEEQVSFHQQLLGGGFGRRSLHDNLVEAALLSQAVQKPVKLIWTREDDIQYGHYRPMSLQRMEASVDDRGKLTGLSHVIVGDGSNLIASGGRNAFYDIPHQHLEVRKVETGIRLKHWRSVGHSPNKFAIESLIDEIARDHQTDPLVYRKQLTQKFPKALATLEKVEEMSNWHAVPTAGRAKGIAFGERSGAVCSAVCEISLDKEKGIIKVHHFWFALDAGIIIQPENVVAQIEGGIIMGMSSVLHERISIDKGAVEQSNFHDYPLLRMSEIPESIEVAILPSTEDPQGVGEASTPLVGAAIANAFASLTGKSIRHMPFTPEKVKEVLES